MRAAVAARKLPTGYGTNIRPDILGGVPGEWLEAGDRSRGVLLYLHGGGYVTCSPRTHRAITSAYARQGFAVFAPAYRLAPEHPFPAAVDDAEAAWHALVANGHAPGSIVVSGDSAGGGLCLALMLRLRAGGHALPAAAALFSPLTDLACTGASMIGNAARDPMYSAHGALEARRAYLGAHDPATPLASPLYADLRHLPPLLIHVGKSEVLRDDSTRLAARARKTGVAVHLRVWPVVPHVWQIAQFVPEARESLELAASFLGQALALQRDTSEELERL